MPPAFAEGAFCSGETGTVVTFGNGIMSEDRDDAGESRDKIRDSLYATLAPEEFNKLEFDLAYNESYGLMADLYESLKQRLGQDNVVVSFWRWLGGREVIPDEVQEELLKMATRFDFSTMVGEEDLANHLALYRNSILEGKKVMVVAHSQGNLFANAAYEILYHGSDPIQSRSLGITAVGTPASFVGGDGPYTTLVEDGVIAVISLATVTGVLPPLFPNITNILSGATTSDWRGHNFIEEYMAEGSRSVTKIISDTIMVMTGLEQPPQTVQDGIITATLTWGPQPDVDLHAFEPNGFHVYYSARNGASGYLDLDDTSGYGPEHYYVSCATLEAGTYSIGVNYYSGSAPETAFVQIAAGTSVRSFSIPLAESVGTDGNTTPVPVANVVVGGDATVGYTFDIQGIATPQ